MYRGRGRGGGRGGGRGRGRGGLRGGRPAPAPAVHNEELDEETTSFFSGLTGARRGARRHDSSNAVPVEAASSSLPGAALQPTQGVEGSEQTQDRVMWLELGLCKALVRAVSHVGFIAPTPVQAEAIPAALSGSDVCARAVTGSGKTAAFLLPVAHQLLTKSPVKATTMNSKRRFIRAVILLPTRELGVQCQSMLAQLLQFTTGLTVALAIGGVAAAAQEAALDAVPDILIATPGRLVDFIHNFHGGKGLDLTGVEMLVLDECDRMLTVNLQDQVVDVMNHIPEETRQVLLFSATMTTEVDEFAKEHLFRPKNVDIGHVALQSKLRQQFVRIRTSFVAPGEEEGEERESKIGGTRRRLADVRAKRRRSEAGADGEEEVTENEQDHIAKVKARYLVALCQNYIKDKTMIFCKYRSTTHRLAMLFNALELPSVEIQGNQTQQERFDAYARFAEGSVHYLITTDVASRGLDIKGVATVINYDLPPTLTAYIHRVGRTARIGETGTAVSLVHEVEDAEMMRKILAVSGAINEHQVASVKRRDVSEELLAAAGTAIDDVFPRVRAILAAEKIEEKIAAAEKQFSAGGEGFLEGVTAKAKKEWCLSREERKAREAEARRVYEKEAEVTVNRFQNELSGLEREESALLQQQKKKRRVEREKKARDQDKVKERARELRKKEEKKVHAGAVKKLKKRKIREAVKERRAEAREKKGVAPYKHGNGKQKNKKSRHRKRMKKH